MVINRNLKYGTRAAECYKGHINYSDIDESLKSLEARKSESDDIKLSSKRRRKLLGVGGEGQVGAQNINKTAVTAPPIRCYRSRGRRGATEIIREKEG